MRLTKWFSKLSRCTRSAAAELRQSAAGELAPWYCWYQRLRKRRVRKPGEQGSLKLRPAQASRSRSSERSSLHYSRLSSLTTLSHVAGIQAGGALFPLEISDKKSLPSPFSFSRTGYGCGAAVTQGAQGRGLRGAPRAAAPNPSCWAKGFLGLGASPAAGCCLGAWHLPRDQGCSWLAQL